MSKHVTSLVIETDVESAYDSALRCLTEQEYRLVGGERPKRLEMERGKPWYLTAFLFPGIATSWKDHYCHIMACFIEDAPGRVRIELRFNWKYSIMRPVIMGLVEEEIASMGIPSASTSAPLSVT
jgi:hypothetical protein